MATGAVLQYLREVYSQPSIYSLWSNQTSATNMSHPGNTSLFTYETTDLITVHDEVSQLPMSAAHFGLATGLLAIVLNSRLSSKLLKTDTRINKYQQWAEALVLRVLFGLVCLLVSATVAPLVAVAFIFLALYRQFVQLTLSLTNPSFACLLEGTDAVWALEDDTSKSIINVLAFFEVEIVDNVFKPQLLGMLRRLMRERILTSPESCPKFWQYSRRSRLGYFYWERQKEVRVEEHVQYMTQEDDDVNLDAPDLTEDCFRQEYYGMSESVLKGLVSELANSPLPFDNAASWEILVGRDPILEDIPEIDPFEAMEEGNPEASGRYRRYPVLFRVHHSMGDGVALIKLLLETLADKNPATQPRQGIVTTKILRYDNEEETRLTRRKTWPRLDNIDVIKCSTGSFHGMNRNHGNQARRPSSLDLSFDTPTNLRKKLNAEYFSPETVHDDLSESLEISDNNSPNISYMGSPKSIDDTSEDCEVDAGEYLGSSSLDREEGVLHRDLYCYPVAETIVTLPDPIQATNEILLNHNKKTIYFDNTVDGEREASYNTPPSKVQPLRDESPPPRCKSPMPPFRRDVSRIARVLDEITETKCKPKNGSSPTESNSSVTIILDEATRSDSIFLMDNSPPPLAKPEVALSPYFGYDARTLVRNESPVPKIHRKKYPVVVCDDDDSEDSPPTSPKGEPQHPRKNALRLQNDGLGLSSSLLSRSTSTSRAQSPFLRNNTPVVRREDSPIMKNYRHDDSFAPRSNSPLMRNNSPLPRNEYHPIPRCNSPSTRSNTPVVRREDSPPRSHSPILKNYSNRHDDSFAPRSNSPLMRNYSPLPRNEYPIPRCNSPFMRNNTPLPLNENPIPRCNSPFMRNNTPLPLNENPIPRCNSPFMRNNTPLPLNENPIPRCNSPFMRNNTPLPLNENPIPRCNSPFMRNNTPLPLNENPIPRCNSPFMRNYTPVPRNDTSFSRCNSPLMRNNGVMPHGISSQFQQNDSPSKKSKAYDCKTPLYLTNSCYNPRVNDMLSITSSILSTVDKSSLNCSYVDSASALKNRIPTNQKTKATMHEVPLTSSLTYTEQFIRGNFFSPDGEVINRSSVSPNCFVKLLDTINHRPSVMEHVCSYVKNTCALVFAPAALIHQTMVKAADINPLHGPDLSGQKIVGWYFDSSRDASENLMSTIKRIKGRMSEARFTDVFLSALSSSLESYFLRNGCDSKCMPETVSVVIPVRMTTREEIEEAMSLKNREEKDAEKIPAMENKFSVGLLSLPMTSISVETKLAKPFSPIGRLREICKHTDLLRKSPDYHINYWLMRVVSTYLPVPLLAPVLNSTQSTMVVSNLVGPPSQLELGGYHLKDIVFWVPNRGSTGVGVSVLSYAGRLQIGIVADRALLPCQQDANLIIEGIVSELQCLDNITAPIKTHPATL